MEIVVILGEGYVNPGNFAYALFPNIQPPGVACVIVPSIWDAGDKDARLACFN